MNGRGIRRTGLTLMIWLTAVFAFTAVPSFAGEAGLHQQFLKAVSDYENGEYVRAAEAFRALADSGIHNGELYYNLGNAYFRAGELGRAICWYEKARQMLPADPELAFNLDYARSFVKDRQPEQSSLARTLFFWRYLLSQKITVYLAGAARLLFFVVLFWRKVFRPRPPGWLLSAILAVFLVFAVTAAVNFYLAGAFPRGVILPGAVSVKSGLSELSTELFILHSGSCVTIEDSRKDYYRIRFGGDKVGWIQQEKVGLISLHI